MTNRNSFLIAYFTSNSENRVYILNQVNPYEIDGIIKTDLDLDKDFLILKKIQGYEQYPRYGWGLNFDWIDGDALLKYLWKDKIEMYKINRICPL